MATASRQQRRADEELLARPLDGRPPPAALASEEAVLATLVVRDDYLAAVREIVKPADFYGEANRRIFEAMCAVADSGRVLDMHALGGHLRDQDRLEQVGGMAYLTELVASAAGEARLDGVLDHARIVAARAQHRRAILAAQLWVARSYLEPTDDVSASIRGLTTELDGLGQEASSRGFTTVYATLVEATRELREASSGKGPSAKRVGLEAIDGTLGGLFDSDLTVIAARPGMGKTSLAMQCLVAVAGDLVSEQDRRVPRPAVVFSMEMSGKQLLTRTACSQTRDVAYSDVRRGIVSRDGWNQLTGACSFLANLPIVVDDRPKLHIDQIAGALHTHQRKLAADGQRIGIVVVDYLQIMRFGDQKGSNRTIEIGDTTSAFKALAKELATPILLLAQLNREVEKEQRPPRMSDLRDSGSIEQDADNIIFIHRKAEEPSVAKIIVAKQRNGAPGEAVVGWNGPQTRFHNLEGHNAY